MRLHLRGWASEGPANGPGVLLLHGLASTSHIWDLVAPRLARAGLRALAYDQRGHGRSTKPSSGYGFERMSADAVAVIRATGLRRPLVVGHSWGANVALDLAVRHPRAVRGIVLVDRGFVSMRDRFDWATAKEVLEPPDLRGMSVEDLLRHVRTDLGRRIRITPEIETFVHSMMRIGPDGTIRPRLSRANHLRILRALWEQDAAGLLRRVRVPTLVLAVRPEPGSTDSAGRSEEKRRAASAVRAIGDPVRFEWIDGIHNVPLQRPAALAARIVAAATVPSDHEPIVRASHP